MVASTQYKGPVRNRRVKTRKKHSEQKDRYEHHAAAMDAPTQRLCLSRTLRDFISFSLSVQRRWQSRYLPLSLVLMKGSLSVLKRCSADTDSILISTHNSVCCVSSGF